jgi:2'-5' RNA ligase
MRTFIALPLPEEIKNFLANIQDELKPLNLDAKWVEPQNIHLTLKFLGEIKEEKLPLIKKIMDDLCKDTENFKISLSYLGTFPPKGIPRVIWVGIEEGEKQTKDLAQKLEEKLKGIGIPKEKRPFSSHITLARLRSSKNTKSLIEKLNKQEKFNKIFFAQKINLYKSTLTPQGPIYEEIYTSNLKIN